MLVDLPRELRDSLEALSNGLSPQQLSRASAALSARYREDSPGGAPIARSPEDVAAYVAYRFPATYAATVAAFEAVKELRGAWRPTSVLDLGAGPGAGLWAATRVWPGIERVTAIDAEPAMIGTGKRLAERATHPALRSVDWIRADLRQAELTDPYDLVLVAYVLGEVEPSSIAAVIDRAWQAATGVLVIVEPGTPAGWRRIRAARDEIAARGGFSIAPCPHDPPCEIGRNDWMHFSVRLSRSRLHRTAKGAELGYEDEKFSYVAMSRTPVDRDYCRILRHPQLRKGHVYLQLCTPDGVQTVVISRRDGDLYNRARKASWGDIFELPADLDKRRSTSKGDDRPPSGSA